MYSFKCLSTLAVTLAMLASPALARQTDVLVVDGTSVGIAAGLPEVIRTPFASNPEPEQETIIQQTFYAYPTAFRGGVRVASGDVNGDGVAEVITGTGAGAQPHVKVFDGRSGQSAMSFFPYGPSFTGGVFVAAGDVNGDGFADIITGAGNGAPGGHVKVFDGQSGAELQSFLAFPGFSGGVSVVAGDVNGDSLPDIIVGAGPGAPGGHVKVFSGSDNSLLRSFLPYPTGFSGGVFVAAGDVDGDGRADIITGAGPGAGPHVKVFDGNTGAELSSFFAFEPTFSGGVRVGAADRNDDGRADLLVVPGPGFGDLTENLLVFDGLTAQQIDASFIRDPNGVGLFVAAGQTIRHRPPCFGDADGNRTVEFADITATLSNFGRTCP